MRSGPTTCHAAQHGKKKYEPDPINPFRHAATASGLDDLHEYDAHQLFEAKLHDGCEKDGLKHRIGQILDSRRFEFFVLALVLFEVGLVGLECGVDYHFFCVRGRLVPVGADQLYNLGLAHDNATADDHPHSASGPAASVTAHLMQAKESNLSAGNHSSHSGFAPISGSNRFQDAVQTPESHTSMQSDPGSGALNPIALVQIAFDGTTQMLSVSTIISEEVEQNDVQTATAEDGEGFVLAQLDLGGSSRSRDREDRGAAHRIEQESKISPEHMEALRKAILYPGIGHHGPASLLCEDHHGPRAKAIEDVCFYLSTVILSFFLLELLLKIWVNPSHFFNSSAHVLDLFVVGFSLFVQVLLVRILGRFGYLGEMAVSLLVLCRLWRILRIAHTVFVVGHDYQKRAKHLKTQHTKLTSDLSQALEKVSLYEAFHAKRGLRSPNHRHELEDESTRSRTTTDHTDQR